MNARDHGDDTGSTLVELAVALAVVSLLIALLAPTVRFGTRAWETSADIEARSAVPVAFGFVERHLEDARLMLLRSGDGGLVPSFTGAAGTLDFVAPEPPTASLGGLYHYRLSAEPTGSGQDLMLTFSPVLPGPAAATRVQLAAGVQDFSLRYFGAVARGAEPLWQPTWAGYDRLPALVELRVTIREAGREVRHRVVIEPKNRTAN